MSTLIALLRSVVMETKPKKQKERNNNESTSLLQQKTNSAAAHRTRADRCRYVGADTLLRNADLRRYERESFRSGTGELLPIRHA